MFLKIFDFFQNFKIFLKHFEISKFQKIFAKIFPKQQNLFAFYISKPKIPEDLHPWLTYDDKLKIIKFNKVWGENVYKKNHPSVN